MAAQTYLSGTIATLLSTELNSLANNALVAGTAFSASNYFWAEFELKVTFGTGPTTGGVTVWLLRALDGTNYEDGSTSVTPLKNVAVSYGVRAVTTAQTQTKGPLLIPPGTWIPLLKNDGTAVAFAATGNTLKILPSTPQV
jgi:hypothetical protein